VITRAVILESAGPRPSQAGCRRIECRGEEKTSTERPGTEGRGGLQPPALRHRAFQWEQPRGTPQQERGGYKTGARYCSHGAVFAVFCVRTTRRERLDTARRRQGEARL